MQLDNIKAGINIVTNDSLESTRGMLVAERHLAARRPGIQGVIKCYVPGHGGDVWAIEHDDGSVAVYVYTEFEQDNF